MLARVGAASILGITLIAAPTHANAQSGGADTFFRASDIGWAGAFAVGADGVSQFDPRIAKYFQQPEHQKNKAMRSVANAFTHVQETTLTIGGILTYGVARLAGARDVEVVALHATESIVAASLTSQVIRGPLGRARPKDATPIFEDQYEFHWFDGFSHFQYRAFPVDPLGVDLRRRDVDRHRDALPLTTLDLVRGATRLHPRRRAGLRAHVSRSALGERHLHGGVRRRVLWAADRLLRP